VVSDRLADEGVVRVVMSSIYMQEKASQGLLPLAPSQVGSHRVDKSRGGEGHAHLQVDHLILWVVAVFMSIGGLRNAFPHSEATITLSLPTCS